MTFSRQQPVTSQCTGTSCQVTSQNVTLTPADAQRTTSVRVDSKITLRLRSNVTTGYRYTVQSPLDLNVLKLTGSAYESTPTGLVGAPGVQVFTFEAPRIGTDVITMVKTGPSGETVETLRFLVSVNFVGRI